MADPSRHDSATAGNDDELTRTVIARPGAPRASAAVEDDRAHYLAVVEGSEPGSRFEVGDFLIIPGRTALGMVHPRDPTGIQGCGAQQDRSVRTWFHAVHVPA